MLSKRIIFIFGFLLYTSSVLALSRCTEDVECSGLQGSVCRDGECVCPAGQQAVLGGTSCMDAASYYTSPCVEDHQCSHLVSGFTCRKDNPESQEGNCYCQQGFHYFRGRCWVALEYGATCNRAEECLGVIRDPFAMTCDGVCTCADGYYQRQRGECRKIANTVGEGCVINEDCQFDNGACDINTFRCYEVIDEPVTTEGPMTTEGPVTEEPDPEDVPSFLVIRSLTRQHGIECGTNSSCGEPFVCSSLGACVCPPGYYASNDGSFCLAQLSSPVTTEDQCVGLFAEVRDGMCTCQANFFFEENMRDCIKVSRLITESCVTDFNCHTFGANARCSPPQAPWGLRTCECNPDLSVWDANRDLCRLFAGIGESCEINSDCMAGDMEIVCSQNEFGEGYCTCPEGYVGVDGLCLTSGLELGDVCQATQECTGTENTVCEGSRCSCAAGYQEIDDECAPTIGGSCDVNTDCTIENTICVTENNSSTCQCDVSFITYDDFCWPMVTGYQSFCNVTEQCVTALGAQSSCEENKCVCAANSHYRDGGCWNRIGLFETCSRNNECYLQDISERVVCRNSLCQCSFDFPYSEELHTCTSGAPKIFIHISLILTALYLVWK